MKKKSSSEFLFTIVALLISIVVVHTVYVLHVRPVAEATLQADREQMQADPNYVPQRSIEVVLKDYE